MSWLDAGWQVFDPEPAVADWVAAARGPALAATCDPAQRAIWLRHDGTWFVGVGALENDAQGRVAGGPPLGGAAFRAAASATGVDRLHRAQVSVTFPGYPGSDVDDSEAAHRFRWMRDAAHLDGLLPEGLGKRRHLREPHAWILGLPLTEADAGAAPLVVWDRSHDVIRRAFAGAFEGVLPQGWGDVDVTDIYKAARAEVFEACARVEVPLRPGQSVLLHRLSIHGVAPWAEGAEAEPEGRVIAYFRPCFEDPGDWLARP